MTRRILPDTPRPDAPDAPEWWEVQAREEVELDRELAAAIRTMLMAVFFIVASIGALIWWLV